MEWKVWRYVLMGVPVILLCVLGGGSWLMFLVEKRIPRSSLRLGILVFCVALLYLLLFVLLASGCILQLQPQKGKWMAIVFLFVLTLGFSCYACKKIFFFGNFALSPKPENLKPEDRAANPIEQQLQHLFEQERIYRRFDLRIEEVARQIGSNRTYVSAVINQRFGMNFLHYVNSFRIREAQKLMITTERPVKEIAELVGFNSLSVFNRFFKEHCGCSPTKWRKKEKILLNQV